MMPRYIDAEKLLMLFNDWALTVSPDERHEGTERLIRQVKYETIKSAMECVEEQPSAQQTLYGYKIEHLAYIAKVMEKEGVSAEYAVRTFDDMSRTMRMIIEEAQRKVEEALNG